MNAISRFFVQLARQMKHNPDGITESGLTKGMTKLLDRFVASGALVAPIVILMLKVLNRMC